MCGIVAYKGSRRASPILLKSIKALEYRGYDSVGMALLNNDVISLRKDIGRVGEVDDKVNFEELEGNLGLAHTRWATHGGVIKDNAHPHLSNNGKIAVVHNGIIENYQVLRDFLKEQGLEFSSETDTEVIPNYIEHLMSKGKSFDEAFRQTLLQIKGSYAVVAFHQEINKIIGGRNGSPLVLGVGDGEFFAASDVPAFIEHTKNVIFLEDEEYFVAGDNGFSIHNTNDNNLLEKNVEEVNWNVEQAKKGNYPHFMLKEINEQKFTVSRAIEQDPDLITKATESLNNAYGVFFVGCGTSYHACVSASYSFSKVAKKHVNVVLASEFRNYEHFLTDKTLVVAVSQSGETADLLDAIKFAKKHNCKTMSIVNVMGSTLTRLSDTNIMMNAGPEICVLSTKSYTSQLAILTMLAYSSAGKLSAGKELIKKASLLIEDLINENEDKLAELAKTLLSKGPCRDMFLIGRDLAFPSALEGALKIKEVSYIHAEGFAGAELKHGTIALIDPAEKTPTIVLSTNETRGLILSNANEIKSRGGYIIGIDSEANNVYDYHIKVPSVGDADPLLMIIPIQILAYHLAVQKGCDPDYPRGLAKCVTVR